jgi:trans-aconitate methyltransferase
MSVQQAIGRGARRILGDGWIYRVPRYYERTVNETIGNVRTKATNHVLSRIDRDHVGAVLDIACGTGITTHELARALPHAQVTGVDRDRGMLRAARRHAPNNCTFVDGNALTLNHRPVDLVTCFLGFSVISQWRESFDNTRQLLKSGGAYAIFDYHDESYLPQFAADQSRRLWELVEQAFAIHETKWLDDDGFFVSIGQLA